MSHIPWGSVLLLIVVDTLVIVVMSAMFGVAVARTAGAKVWTGLAVGLFLPVIGPLVWGIVVSRRSPDARAEADRRGPSVLAASGLFGLAATLFLVATPLAWGHVSGTYEDYALRTSAAPADTGVGLVATVGSAILLFVALGVLLMSGAHRLVAGVTGFISGSWLLVSLDAWIVLSALDGVAHTAEGASGGRVVAEASPAAGLWLCLVAAVIALAGTVVVLFGVPSDAADEPPVRVPAPESPPAWSPSDSSDWGAPVDQGSARAGSSDWGSTSQSDWGGER